MTPHDNDDEQTDREQPLTDDEAIFVAMVRESGGELTIPHSASHVIAMVRRLAARGLVTVDDSSPYYVSVTSVRPGEGE